MKPAIREALDRLALEVQSDKGQRDLSLIEAEFLGHEEMLGEMRGDLIEIKDLLVSAEYELARAREFAA